MARTRPYSVQFNNVSVSALQDLIAVYCGANMAIELHGLDIGQITGTTVQNLRISLKRLAATVTAGTGGSAPTPQKMMRGDIPFETINYYGEANDLAGRTFDASENIFNISYRRTPRKLGDMRLTIAPMVRSVKKRLEYTAKNDEIEIQYVAPVKFYLN